MKNPTYETAKLLIVRGRYEREHLLDCLDIFLLGKRISKEEYTQLISMINKERK